MIGNNWDKYLKEEYEKEYFKKLKIFLEEEYKNKIIYPKKSDIFNAFKYTDINNLKVVIIGQDPYHEINQAEGLAFSVKDIVKKPQSLRNIFKELEEDLSYPFPKTNSLIPWAKEGILLLNTVLTVEEGKAASHKNKGWEIFTDKVIKIIDDNCNNIVFILWGNFAITKEKIIKNKNNLIIKSAHPSPLSAYNGFFGSKPFSKTNNYLKAKNIKEINWQIK